MALERMLKGANDAAIEAAGRAQAIGEPLGVSEALIDALNTQGCVPPAPAATGSGRCIERWRWQSPEASRIELA